MITAPRIGCVPYLNARPLLEGLPYPVRELVPSMLGDAFLEGEFDVALLSSIDVIASPNPCAVDGVSISSKGDVHSVVLAYQGDLDVMKKVNLDPDSHTSNLLLRIVLEEFYGFQPKYVHLKQDITIEDDLLIPTLLIGDRAIETRKRTSAHLRFLDLGGEWFSRTGLPFVFALWSLKIDYTNKTEIASLLRHTKERGIAAIGRIASGTPDPEFTRRYLGGAIRYELGEEEKLGLELFRDFLVKKGIADIQREIKYF
jgi:predicted solute-binding protein